MDDLSRFCCLNSQCPDYGRRGGENLSVTMRYGKHKHLRMLRCGTCTQRFSERKGTPLFRSRLSDDKRQAVLEHLNDGCGVRQTERLVKVHRDTVMRYSRLAGDPNTLKLITTDEYAPYSPAILQTFGRKHTPPRTGKPGRPRKARYQPPENLLYATVHKTRRKGRVVKIECRPIFGTESQVQLALAESHVSKHINISFVERHNGTDRHRNARKGRKTYRFSKDQANHDARTYYTIYSYNFCWPVRTLSRKDQNNRAQRQTPAMAAGLTDHVWTLNEWLTLPAIQRV